MRRFLLLLAAAIAVLSASQLAAADPVGDQFRVSTMGPDGDIELQGNDPAIAHNSRDNQSLYVWHGDNDDDGQFEVWGQLVGPTGTRIGGEIQISESNSFSKDDDGCGVLGGACDADVAYNSRDNEYMVVFEVHFIAQKPTGLFSGPEIFAQRLAADGTELSTGASGPGVDEQISSLEGDTFNPKIAYNSVDNEYMSVFEEADFEEIWAQRLGPDGSQRDTGTSTGDDDGFVSDRDDSEDPDIAHNSQTNRYTTVWHADTGKNTEVFGQQLSAGGTEVPDDEEFQVSEMGATDLDRDGEDPAITYNPITNEDLVVWEGDVNSDGKDEIHGQRLNADGGQVGTNDFRLSTSPASSDSDVESLDPAVDADVLTGEYLVAWHGAAAPDDFEIYGQKLDGAGGQIGTDDFRISVHGPEGDSEWDGEEAAVAYTRCEYLAGWEGDITVSEGEDEDEIHGRRVSGNSSPCVTPTAAPAPAPPVAQQPAAVRPGRPSVRVAGVRRACLSRDSRVRVRIRTRPGATLRSVRVTLNGRRLRAPRRSRFSVAIDIDRIKPGRRVRLRIVVRDSAGNRVTVRRTIARCAQARRRAAPRFTG